VIQRLGSLVPRIHPTAWIHEMATVIGDVEIGAYSSVWPGAVLRGDYGPIRVGERTNVQDGTVVHAGPPGTFIGSSCVIGHLAFIEDAVVEDFCLVGVGAKVLNGSRLREGSAAVAGAVLVAGIDVPAGHRAQGVPARIVAIDQPGRQWVADAAERYAEVALRHAREAVTVEGRTGAAGDLVRFGVDGPAGPVPESAPGTDEGTNT
jgi:carbonic anhydrase/acetyltransferase-like protein (isoleucine patch superfamily)